MLSYSEINKLTYKELNRWALGLAPIALLALWAFFEAGVWFVVPDFLLFVLVLLQPKRWKTFLCITIVFSLLGTSFYLAFVSFNHTLAAHVLGNTPLVQQWMLDKIDTTYIKQGIYGALRQATTIIPLKVWTFQAVQHGFSPAIYLLFIVPSRVLRMSLCTLIGYFVGTRNRKFLENNVITLLSMYLIIFSCLLFYFEGRS